MYIKLTGTGMRHRFPFMVVIAPAVLVPELMRITDEDQPQLRFTPQLGGFYWTPDAQIWPTGWIQAHYKA